MKIGEMHWGTKWLIGVSGSWLVGIDETLRELALVLGLIVTFLTIINLSIELYRKLRRKK